MNENIGFLKLQTVKERILFGLVAVTAGFCEEVIFRGTMLYYLSHLPFDISLLIIGILSSVLFGIVHLYQGWLGVTQVTILGGLLFCAFTATGSLWVPIILHFLVDVKFVFYPKLKSE